VVDPPLWLKELGNKKKNNKITNEWTTIGKRQKQKEERKKNPKSPKKKKKEKKKQMRDKDPEKTLGKNPVWLT
jgi:hypothetical protein